MALPRMRLPYPFATNATPDPSRDATRSCGPAKASRRAVRMSSTSAVFVFRIACALGLSLAATAQAQVVTTLSYAGSEIAILDGSGSSTLSIDVDGLGNLVDVDVRLDALPGCDATVGNSFAAIMHAAVGELTISLVSPNNTQVVLYNRRGGQRDNFCTTLFDDDGGFPGLGTLSSVNGQTVSGNFAPDNPLSTFDGEPPNGVWRLRIADSTQNGVAGTARRFSLIARTHPPAEILVNKFDDPPPNGCTSSSCSLREAMALANLRPGFDRIVLPPGTFQLTRAGANEGANLTGDLNAAESVEIIGAGPDLSIVQQNATDRVLQSYYGLHLRRVSLRGGRAVSHGGAVQGGGLMLIEDVDFLYNSAGRGGALQHGSSGYTDPSIYPLTLRRVRFEGNEAGNYLNNGAGGAVAAGGGTGGGLNIRYRMRVEQSSFIDNRAEASGGALNFDADGILIISDSEFTGNELTDGGGGGAIATDPLPGDGLQLTILRSRFEANRASATSTSRGGAIYASPSDSGPDGETIIADSTFCNNVASASGGAIHSSEIVRISGSTFCSNQVQSTDTADLGGGAIGMESGDLVVTRSSLVNNSALRGGAIAIGQVDLVLGSSTLTAPTFGMVGSLGTLLRYNSATNGDLLSMFNNVLIGSCSYANSGINPDAARNNIEASNSTCRLATATVGIGNQTSASIAAINLGPLADNGGFTQTRLPAAGSIAINAANTATCLALDQRGYARSDAVCDIGAVEVGGVPSADVLFANGFD